MTELTQTRQEQSLGELFAELTREITTLFRQEVTLARTEISQKVSRVGRHVGFIAAGAAIAYAGLLALVAAVICMLAEHTTLSWWASALIVGIVVAGLGGLLAWKGLDALKHEDLAPRKTLETLKEDKQWVQGQAG